jgi:hypothetical protein
VGALAAGYALGARVKGTQGAAVGGALALGAIGGASAFALNAAAPHVAAVQVRNALVNHSDPSSLRSTEIDAIAQKYGSSCAPLLCLSYPLILLGFLHLDLASTQCQELMKSGLMIL